MPTLLQISAVANLGSVGRIAEQIGENVMAQGWKSYITYSRGYNSSKSNLIKVGNKFEIYWHVLMTRIFDTHGLHSKIATKNLIKYIEKIKPDIIQIHNIHGYYINMEILFNYLSSLSIPVVWTFHDCWPLTGHCVHFDQVKCYKWKTECFDCIQKKEYPKSCFFDRSKKNFQLKKKLFTSVNNMTIISVSKWLKNLIRQSFFSDYPIKVIQNGINTKIFSPAKNVDEIREKYGIIRKKVLLGVATTWGPRKGLNDFIKLSSLLDESFVIILVGLKEEQIKLLPSNIIGIKRTENIEELVKLYSLADIHISFSMEETFGLTIVESMACGTPVIVYNATACPELITSNTGIIVEKNNLHDVIQAIKVIINNGKEYYSCECRKRAVDHFDIKDRFSEYVSLYKELLNI